MTVPYTYLIGWTSKDLWYYGVRYANNCNPNELFVSYFTSSVYVKEIINTLGVPDVIEVRKIFNNKTKARQWEHKVLTRLDVINKSKWLNKTNNISFSPEICRDSKLGSKNPMFNKKGKLHPWFGKQHTNETKKKISLSHIGTKNAMYNKKHKRVICPHCHKEGPINMMTRWHFDNCNTINPRIKKPSPSKYKRTKYISIFVNIKTGQYVYMSMKDFSTTFSLNYNSIKYNFSKGKIYKNWIRL